MLAVPAPVSAALAAARARLPGPGPDEGGSPAGGTDTALLERPREGLSAARPWNVVVWNDPVNLMSYVAYVFRSHFGYTAARAQALMLEVHERGRSVVFTGGREVAEGHVGAMHRYGLWATLEQAED